MAFTRQEREALHFQLSTLLDASEPEAMLATFRRLCERIAWSVTRGVISRDEAERWRRIADILAEAELVNMNVCLCPAETLSRPRAPA